MAERVPAPAGDDAAAFVGLATRAFEAWKLGQKGKDNGVLVIVAPSDRNIASAARCATMIQTISRDRGLSSYRPACIIHSSIAVAMPSARLIQTL